MAKSQRKNWQWLAEQCVNKLWCAYNGDTLYNEKWMDYWCFMKTWMNRNTFKVGKKKPDKKNTQSIISSKWNFTKSKYNV